MTAEGMRLSLAQPPVKGSVKAVGGGKGLKSGGIYLVSALPGLVRGGAVPLWDRYRQEFSLVAMSDYRHQQLRPHYLHLLLLKPHTSSRHRTQAQWSLSPPGLWTPCGVIYSCTTLLPCPDPPHFQHGQIRGSLIIKTKYFIKWWAILMGSLHLWSWKTGECFILVFVLNLPCDWQYIKECVNEQL